jgi:hypothetical protein
MGAVNLIIKKPFSKQKSPRDGVRFFHQYTVSIETLFPNAKLLILVANYFP